MRLDFYKPTILAALRTRGSIYKLQGSVSTLKEKQLPDSYVKRDIDVWSQQNHEVSDNLYQTRTQTDGHATTTEANKL